MSDAQLDAMIAALRRIPEMARAVAPEAAEAVGKELKTTAAAGRAPDGSTWQQRKDGGQPLANAAAAIRTRALDTVILITLEGHHVWHHNGTSRVPQRQIIPHDEVPDGVADAIKSSFVVHFDKEIR